jgi:hypothetical protein
MPADEGFSRQARRDFTGIIVFISRNHPQSTAGKGPPDGVWGDVKQALKQTVGNGTRILAEKGLRL